MIRCIYSPFSDIYFHLAAEEYLLKQGNEDIFMLWQDTPSVVMGKHQSVQLEVNREWAEEQQIQIARRFSGGGAVYHDLGNVNLTFIETVSRLPDFSLYLHRILDFLEQIGLPAKGDERLGIYLDGLKILVRRDVLILSVRKNWKQSINFGLRNIFAKTGSSVVESG